MLPNISAVSLSIFIGNSGEDMERRLELIGEMTLPIWIHLIAVLLAAIIGAFVLWRRKGDGRHKLWGRCWVVLMAVVAISSFWIVEIMDGGFSPIHLLSIYTLSSIAIGVYSIRFGKRTPAAIERHRDALQGLYAAGIMVAGAFTLMPNRLLGRLTFGESYPWINYGLVAIIAVCGLWLMFQTHFRKIDVRQFVHR
ncbi:transmembrane protein [Ahrensia sp. R2A130]|nr:transmembrane protein [Ahrensia sp. R2A130]